jgi:Ca-activated chloride channel family protein
VTDKAGRLVPDLTRDDFEVLDNGKVQPLTLFDNSPQPIRLIVMLDVSGSMSGNLRLLRDACDQLFARLAPGDLARVGTFGEQIIISPSFTRDVAELGAALPVTIPQNAPTPLWNAVDTAIAEFGAAEGRRVVLVLSDGKDSGPRFGQRFLSPLEIIDRAQREDVMIYAVGLHSRGGVATMPGGGRSLGDVLVAGLPDPGLGRVALETGGGYFEIRPRDDLGIAFARVADELHHQYLLGFSPRDRDGKLHKIEVRLRPKDLKPRARKNYQAASPRRPTAGGAGLQARPTCADLKVRASVDYVASFRRYARMNGHCATIFKPAALAV